MYGARIDLGIAIAATMLSLIVGVTFGILAGYSPGRISEATSRVSDTVQAFPVFIVALGLAAATGSKMSNLILIVAFLNAPIYFRLARGETLVLRNIPFVEAAVVAGERRTIILGRHILPNAAGPLLAQASVNAGWALLLTAGLSFVGAGVRPPQAEWGAMIAEGSEHILGGQWWLTVFPGLAILITVMGFGLISEGVLAGIRGGNR
jgi:peptide/nickel transport system permease protein